MNRAGLEYVVKNIIYASSFSLYLGLIAGCGILKPEYRDYQESTAGGTQSEGTQTSYSGSIANLVSSKCTSCHDTGGEAPTLNSYATVKENAAASESAITNERMPPGAPLSASDKSLFSKWVSDGSAP